MTDGGFYADDDRLDYPTAERLTVQTLTERATRDDRPDTVTSVEILRASTYPNDQHNRRRVYDALGRHAGATDEVRRGRHVFAVPVDPPEPGEMG